MPTTEPTPPVRELPDEIEEALTEYRVQVRGNWSGLGEYSERNAETALRNAIRAALDERNTALRESLDRLSAELRAQRAMPPIWFGEDPALRERCERLRQELIFAGANIEPAYGQPPVFRRFIQPGDLADDLRSRE
jgi:hypothetical protein